MSALSLSQIERSLWLCSIILNAALATRFLQLKLAGTYRFFLSYLLFNTLRSLMAWPLNIESASYRYVFAVTEPIVWVLYVLVVLEVCSLVFKEYRGIQALGRWTVYGSLCASILVSTVILVPTWLHSNEPIFSLQRYAMLERAIDFALVLLLLLLLVFLAIFPIELSKNVIVHSILYSVFFMSHSIGFFVLNMTGNRLSVVVSTCLMGVSVLCLMAWMGLLTREGEVKMMVTGQQLPPATEERLIEQLANINAALLRATKKVDTTPSRHAWIAEDR